MPLTFACRTFGNQSYGTTPLASPVLTIDDQTGTEVTFHIAGSVVGSTNRLATQSIGGTEWFERAVRNGDGPLTATLAPGGQWARITSELTGQTVVSNLVFVQVASAEASMLTRCLTAVRSRIVLLGLNGLAPEQVVVAKAATERSLVRPSVVISPQAEAVSGQGTNIRDDVVYRVTIVADSLPPSIDDITPWLQWREQIRAAFVGRRLPGVPSVHSVCVTESDVLSREAWLERNAFVTSLQLELIAREQRAG